MSKKRLPIQYSTLATNEPRFGHLAKSSINDKAMFYVGSIKELAYEDITKLIENEKETLINSIKTSPKERDTTQELKRNAEIILMKSAIEGSSKDELKALAEKYANTEYEEDFKIMIKPTLKGLSEGTGPDRIKNESLVAEISDVFDKIPEEVEPEVNKLDTLLSDVQSMFYFNDKNLNIGAEVSEEGRLLHGHWNTRNIEQDFKNADIDFNPLGVAIEPVIGTEDVGTKTFKTVRYEFDWED